MFNLDEELKKWRRDMAEAGVKSPEILSELEEHLRDDIERQVRSGASTSEAFHAALQRIGQPSVLRSEFDLSRQSRVAEIIGRHKWTLLICSAAGVVAALGLHLLRPTPYQSEAKLLFRYVLTEASTATRESDQPIRITVSPGLVAPMMNDQLELLTSLDLAQEVAEKIGAKKILEKAGGGEDRNQAAAVIRTGLRVRVVNGSSVIHIGFQHPDSALVQPVLREVIDRFLRLHVETYRKHGGFADGGVKVSNISLIQTPSIAFFNSAAAFWNIAMGVAAGVVASVLAVLVLRARSDYWERDARGTG
jgi:uncharacterized protein involved in exopolysaccharide biosynthesis